MFVKTIRVSCSKNQKKVPVYLENKEYVYSVAEKLAASLRKGMLVVADDGQQLYVKDVLSDLSEVDESLYVGEVNQILPNVSVVVINKKNTLKRKNKTIPIPEKAVFKGIIVELKDKKFQKTTRTLKFKSTPKVWEKIQIHDIVRLIVRNKHGEESDCYVLVQEILTNVPKKKRPLLARRRVADYFYQKTPKGYKKVRYSPKERTTTSKAQKEKQSKRSKPKYVIRTKK